MGCRKLKEIRNMKDCTTCKYGYEDERYCIPLCHHPKRFSEDCIDFNMYEESEKLMNQKGLDVTDFCKPIDPGIAQCIADHSWEMLGEDEKPVPADLEEAAEKYARLDDKGVWKDGGKYKGFIAGAKWDREKMMSEAVEGLICATITGTNAISFLSPLPKELTVGDKVRIIVCKKED